MEPVEIDIRLKQNVDAEGKKAVQSIDAIAAATEKAKAMIERHQTGVVELRKDLVGLGTAYKQATSKQQKSEILTEIELTKKNIIDETQAIKVLKAEIASLSKVKPINVMPDVNQVGKAAVGYNSLNFSTQQLVRELPAASMGLNMFFLAISNNIPVLTDGIKRARAENELLKDSGKSITPVWKQLFSSILSWQSLMMVGITIFSMYGKDIANWVKELMTGEKAVKKLTAAQMGLSSANQVMIESLKGGSEFQKAIQSVDQLSSALKNAKGNHELEKKAVDDYNASLGVTFGKVNDVDSALKLINKNKDAYIQSMKAMSFANTFFAESAKDAMKAMEVGLKNQQQILRDAGQDAKAMFEKLQEFDQQIAIAKEEKSKGINPNAAVSIGGAFGTQYSMQGAVDERNRIAKEMVKIETDERKRQLDIITNHQNKSLALAENYYKEYTSIFKENNFVVDNENPTKDKKTGSFAAGEAMVTNKLLKINKELSEKYKKQREDFIKKNQQAVKMGGDKELQELQRIRNEADRIIMQSGSERERIEKEYAHKILILRKDGRFAEIEQLEADRDKKISAVTEGMIKESEVYKLATDEKLNASKETTERLIADIKARIEAEIAAGKISSETAKKMLADINSAQSTVKGNKNQNNPFAQLGDAISGNTSANKALDLGKLDPSTTTDQLAGLESAAASATAGMAGAAGAALAGVKGILGSVVDGMDRLGMLTDEEKKDAENIIGMVGGAADLAMGIASGNPVQIIQGSIDLLVNAFEYFDYKSKDIEKAQKKAKQNIDDLTRAYDRLQRSVDKALGTDVYARQKDQVNNLKKQIAENNALIALELQKKKKKQDAEAIQKWKDETNALNDQIEDITKSISEDLAQTSAKELAQQVGDALVQAAADGTDAFTAMGDVVNDVLKNAVTNALEKQFLEKQMGKATDYLSSAMEDGKLTDAERKQFSEMVTAAGNNYNEALNAYKDILGSSDTAREGAKKGIATASQDSIDELTGGVYALRMGVADIRNNSREQTLVLRTITNQLDTLIDNTEPIAAMAEDIKNMSNDINDIKTRGLNVKV